MKIVRPLHPIYARLSVRYEFIRADRSPILEIEFRCTADLFVIINNYNNCIKILNIPCITTKFINVTHRSFRIFLYLFFSLLLPINAPFSILRILFALLFPFSFSRLALFSFNLPRLLLYSAASKRYDPDEQRDDFPSHFDYFRAKGTILFRQS